MYKQKRIYITTMSFKEYKDHNGKSWKVFIKEKNSKNEEMWLPLTFKHKNSGKFINNFVQRCGIEWIKAIQGLYYISSHARLKLRNGKIVSNKRQVLLSYKSRQFHFTLHVLCAITFLECPEDYLSSGKNGNTYDVDHCDENNSNNHIGNLQIIPSSVHQKKTCDMRSNQSNKKRSITKGKPIILKGVPENSNYSIGTRFESKMHAHRSIGIPYGDILRNLKGERKHVQGYSFEYANIQSLQLLDKEEIKPIPNNLEELYKGIGWVTTKGRIWLKSSKKYTKGRKTKNSKYRYHDKLLIHRIICSVKYGRVVKQVNHDDSAPLDSDNCYRNYWEDLREGDQQENIFEHHHAKRQNKKNSSYLGIRVLWSTNSTISEGKVFVSRQEACEKIGCTSQFLNHLLRTGAKSTKYKIQIKEIYA